MAPTSAALDGGQGAVKPSCRVWPRPWATSQDEDETGRKVNAVIRTHRARRRWPRPSPARTSAGSTPMKPTKATTMMRGRGGFTQRQSVHHLRAAEPAILHNGALHHVRWQHGIGPQTSTRAACVKKRPMRVAVPSQPKASSSTAMPASTQQHAALAAPAPGGARPPGMWWRGGGRRSGQAHGRCPYGAARHAHRLRNWPGAQRRTRPPHQGGRQHQPGKCHVPPLNCWAKLIAAMTHGIGRWRMFPEFSPAISGTPRNTIFTAG